MGESRTPTSGPTSPYASGPMFLFSASTGVIITTTLFALTLLATIFVCIRRCLLIRQLDREHRQLYELELGLVDAPEVHATPYVDVDCFVAVIHSTSLDGEAINSAVDAAEGGEGGEGKCDETHPLSGGGAADTSASASIPVSAAAAGGTPSSPTAAHDVLIDIVGKNGTKPLIAQNCEPFFDGIRR